MFELYDNDTGELIGEIDRKQLDFLLGELEDGSDSDRDYFLDPSTIELLEEAGADDELVEVLQDALGDRDGMEIRWEFADAP